MEQHIGVGRRKSAVARVYLRAGKGKIVINGQTPEKYFGARPEFDEILKGALRETQTLSKFDMVVNVKGGGVKAQVEAIRHGSARALERANPAYRTVLKSLGFLTRDAREKERKKYGLAKARKAYQYSKR